MPGDEDDNDRQSVPRSINVVEPWSAARVPVASVSDLGVLGATDLGTAEDLEPVSAAGFTGVLGAPGLHGFRSRWSFPSLTWPELARPSGTDQPETPAPPVDARGSTVPADAAGVGDTGTDRPASDTVGDKPVSSIATPERGISSRSYSRQYEEVGRAGRPLSQTRRIERVSRVVEPRLELAVTGRPRSTETPSDARVTVESTGSDASGREARVFPTRDRPGGRPDRPAGSAAEPTEPSAGRDRGAFPGTRHDISITTSEPAAARSERPARTRSTPLRAMSRAEAADRWDGWSPVFRRSAPTRQRERGTDDRPTGTSEPTPTSSRATPESPGRPDVTERGSQTTASRDRGKDGRDRGTTGAGPGGVSSVPSPETGGRERPQTATDTRPVSGDVPTASPGQRGTTLSRLIADRGYGGTMAAEPTRTIPDADDARRPGPDEETGAGTAESPGTVVATGPTRQERVWGAAPEPQVPMPTSSDHVTLDTVRRRIQPPSTVTAPADRPARGEYRGPVAGGPGEARPPLNLAARRRVAPPAAGSRRDSAEADIGGGRRPGPGELTDPGTPQPSASDDRPGEIRPDQTRETTPSPTTAAGPTLSTRTPPHRTAVVPPPGGTPTGIDRRIQPPSTVTAPADRPARGRRRGPVAGGPGEARPPLNLAARRRVAPPAAGSRRDSAEAGVGGGRRPGQGGPADLGATEPPGGDDTTGRPRPERAREAALGRLPPLDLATRRRVASPVAGVLSANVDPRATRFTAGEPGSPGNLTGTAGVEATAGTGIGRAATTVFAVPGGGQTVPGEESSTMHTDVEPSQRQDVSQMPEMTLRNQYAFATGAGQTTDGQTGSGTPFAGTEETPSETTQQAPASRETSDGERAGQPDIDLAQVFLDGNAGLMSHDPDVDRFVENLYRAIKRKMREERQRGGL